MKTFLRESFIPVLLLLGLLSVALVTLESAATKRSREPKVIRITARDLLEAPTSAGTVSTALAIATRPDTSDAEDLQSAAAGKTSGGKGPVNRAMAMAAHDSLAEALALTEAILQKNPNDGGAWFARGLIYSRRKDSIKAIEAYEKSVALYGGKGKAVALYNLSCLYREVGRKEDAANGFRRAIDLRPGYLEARLNLAGILGDKPEGRIEAYSQYEQLLRLAPTYAQAWFNRGVLRMTDSKNDDAIADFRRAVEVDPKMSKAWYNIGILSTRQGRKMDAIQAYRRAIEIDPDNTKARLNLSTALADEKQLDEAIRVGQETVRRVPTYASAWYNLAIALAENGHPAEARSAYEKVLKLDPSNARAWQNLGVLFAKEKKSRRAIECYQEALGIDPANIAARYNLALELRRTGDLPAAMTEAMRLYRLDPDHGKAKQFLRTTATRLLEKDPENAQAKKVLEEVGTEETEHAS